VSMAVDRTGGGRSADDRAGSLVVPHHPQGARLGRQRLAAALIDLVPAQVLSDAISVVAELLGNAVQHGGPLPGGVVRLAWHVEPPAVRIRVTDGGSGQSPLPRQAAPDEVDGRGVTIVAALALTWGVEAERDGHCVWAELGPRP